jgi:short-subunit dehydrogenase
MSIMFLRTRRHATPAASYNSGDDAGWALVTGASAGLGAVFAERLASRGHDLVVVARDVARLNVTAADLRARHHVEVEVLAADLVTEAGQDRVAERLSQRSDPVRLLVNNAGAGLYRGFGQAPFADERRMLELNVTAVLRLTHAAAVTMREHGRGTIVNVSSVAAVLPRGDTPTYAATKAWVAAFSENVALGLRGTGVTVTAVCPGRIRTEFHLRADTGIEDRAGWLWLTPESVVDAALAAAARGAISVTPTLRYQVITTLARHLPRPLVRAAMSRPS